MRKGHKIRLSMAFDPYHEWLGISPAEQPPNHYRLLGVAAFESDPDVITAAAEQRAFLVKTLAAEPHLSAAQRLLDELYAAQFCLLSPPRKAQYDKGLEKALSAARQSVSLDMDEIDLPGAPADSIEFESPSRVPADGRIRTPCPACGTRLKLRLGAQIGDRVKCRQCRHRFYWAGEPAAREPGPSRPDPASAPDPRPLPPQPPDLPPISEIESLSGLKQVKAPAVRPLPPPVPAPVSVRESVPVRMIPVPQPPLPVPQETGWRRQFQLVVGLGAAVVALTCVAAVLFLSRDPPSPSSLPANNTGSGTGKKPKKAEDPKSTSKTSETAAAQEPPKGTKPVQPTIPPSSLPRTTKTAPPRSTVPATGRDREVVLEPVEDLVVYSGRTAIYIADPSPPVAAAPRPKEFSDDFDPDKRPQEKVASGAAPVARFGSSRRGRGLRYLSVVGIVPHEKIVNAYQKALVRKSTEKPADRVQYRDFQIQRQALVPGTGTWSAWETLDLGPVREAVSQEFDGWDEEVASMAITDPVFTMPLPPRAMGRWNTHGLHPRLKSYLLSDQDLEEERKKNEAAAAEFHERLKKQEAGGKPGESPPGGFGGMVLNLPQLLRKSPPRLLLFRYIDLFVEPGRTYRYRVRLSLKNPSFGRLPEDVEDLEVARGQTRETPWSEPSPATATEPDAQVFVNRVPRRGGRPQSGAELDIYQWDPALGTLFHGARIPVVAGQTVSAAVRTDRLDLFREVLEERAEVTFFAPEILADSMGLSAITADQAPDLELSQREITSLVDSGTFDEVLMLDARGTPEVYNPAAMDAERKFAQNRYRAQMATYESYRGADPRKAGTLDELIRQKDRGSAKPPRIQNPANPALPSEQLPKADLPPKPEDGADGS